MGMTRLRKLQPSGHSQCLGAVCISAGGSGSTLCLLLAEHSHAGHFHISATVAQWCSSFCVRRMCVSSVCAMLTTCTTDRSATCAHDRQQCLYSMGSFSSSRKL